MAFMILIVAEVCSYQYC